MLLQDDKDLNSKFATSRPMLTMDSSNAMNPSDFHTSEVKDVRKFLSVLEDLMHLHNPLYS